MVVLISQYLSCHPFVSGLAVMARRFMNSINSQFMDHLDILGIGLW